MMNTAENIRFKRRKKITLLNSVMVLISYISTQTMTVVAKVMGLSSISYGQIGTLATFAIMVTLGFIVIIYQNQQMSNLFVNTVFFSQYIIWLVLYTIWTFFLGESRVMGLFFAMLALCFLMSSANRRQALILSTSVCVFHGIAVYWGITYRGQPGNLSQELFYVCCFLPSAVLISYLAGMFKKQRTAIRDAKRSAEQNLDSLQKMVFYIAEKCKTLSDASEELLDLSTNMKTSADEISAKTTKATSASDEVSAKTSLVAADINDASENINNIAVSFEEITATIQEISQNSEKAKTISNKAVTQSRFVSEKVKQLGEAAQEIGKITEVISDISEQTNLLALNATIEAARAGDAGKGFAVVASEIKELAGQTADATHQIKQQIHDIQEATTESVDEIVQNVQIINEIDEIISSITYAIEEQSQNTGNIARNVAQSSHGISEVKGKAVHTSTVVERIAKSIAEVNQDINTISANSTRVKKSAEDLRELSIELKDMTDECATGLA
jgi:methyl-accepting chemotaxis protein